MPIKRNKMIQKILKNLYQSCPQTQHKTNHKLHLQYPQCCPKEKKLHRKNHHQKKFPAKNFRKKVIPPFHSVLLQKLDASDGKDSSTTRELDDPDRMFLLSLLGNYKKLNDDEKLDFKLEVLQFLKQCQHPPSNFHNLLQVNYDSLSPTSSSQSHSQYAAPSSPDSYGQSNFHFFQYSAPAP